MPPSGFSNLFNVNIFKFTLSHIKFNIHKKNITEILFSVPLKEYKLFVLNKLIVFIYKI